MTGRERILTALNVEQPDRVPLYIHGINEAPIIGIGRHLTDALPETTDFYEMTEAEKMKLVDTLFLIHEEFEVDGFTSFEIGHEFPIDRQRVKDDWGIVYVRNPHGLPVISLQAACIFPLTRSLLLRGHGSIGTKSVSSPINASQLSPDTIR